MSLTLRQLEEAHAALIAARQPLWNARTSAEIEGRQGAEPEPKHPSLTPRDVADLDVPTLPAGTRRHSLARKFYVRCLELAGLVVKARQETKEMASEALAYLESAKNEARWRSNEAELHRAEVTKLEGEIRQLKATIHLLTKGS